MLPNLPAVPKLPIGIPNFILFLLLESECAERFFLIRQSPFGDPCEHSYSVIAALRRGNLAAFITDVSARVGEIPAASAGMTVRCGRL